MIEIRNKTMFIPPEDRTVAAETDANSVVRVFRVKRVGSDGIDISALSFRLDIHYMDNDAKDIAVLDKEITEEDILLSWTVQGVTSSHPGTMFANVRGYNEDGAVRWSSMQGAFYVERTIDSAANPQALSELEQLEREIEQKTSALDAAESARTEAESARAEAETNRADAEAERATAEALRVEAENSRVAAETARTEAESGRAKAENQRELAEDERDQAEKQRKSQISGWVEEAKESAKVSTAAAASAKESKAAAATSSTEAAASATGIAEAESRTKSYADKTQKLVENIPTLDSISEVVNDAIQNANHLTFKPVAALPELEEAEENVVYAIPNGETGDNRRTEYILTEDAEGNLAWEIWGSSTVDLSGYYTQEQMDKKLEGYVEVSDVAEITDEEIKIMVDDVWAKVWSTEGT